MPCKHVVRLVAGGETFFDSNIIMMGLRFHCEKCGCSFRAVGVPEGVNSDHPGTTDQGEVTVFPLVPMGEEPEEMRIGRC